MSNCTYRYSIIGLSLCMHEYSKSMVHACYNCLFFVQSSEVNSSYHMEKEGLDRALNHLQDKNVPVGALVTDRHPQINKWMRENHTQVKHYFDVWHVAKGKCLSITVYYIATYNNYRTAQKN